MTSASKNQPQKSSTKGERIAKRLSRAGVCSRREAERWIVAGRVSVNGAVLTTPATLVAPNDAIMVDGKPVGEAAPPRLFRYHKPQGLVTSNADEHGRPTIFDMMPDTLPRVMSVGRLDMNSEGLLLLTTDGALARHMELPATGWARYYRVRAFGKVEQAMLDRLAQGLTIEGVRYGAIEAKLERQQGSNAWLLVTLKEGKNREIRKVFEHIGLTVNRLIRIGYGPFQLGKLPSGAIEEVPQRVVKQELNAVINI